MPHQERNIKSKTTPWRNLQRLDASNKNKGLKKEEQTHIRTPRKRFESFRGFWGRPAELRARHRISAPPICTGIISSFKQPEWWSNAAVAADVGIRGMGTMNCSGRNTWRWHICINVGGTFTHWCEGKMKKKVDSERPDGKLQVSGSKRKETSAWPQNVLPLGGKFDELINLLNYHQRGDIVSGKFMQNSEEMRRSVPRPSPTPRRKPLTNTNTCVVFFPPACVF